MHRKLCLTTILVLLLGAGPALAECFDWPLRRGAGARFVEDADTVFVTVPVLPPKLSALSVQVRGVVAPRTQFGECPEEKKRGLTARNFVLKILSTADKIRFCDPEWDGDHRRILANVKFDQFDLAQILIEKGFGRAPVEGKQPSWCIR